jgi:hypothetical protein
VRDFGTSDEQLAIKKPESTQEIETNPWIGSLSNFYVINVVWIGWF